MLSNFGNIFITTSVIITITIIYFSYVNLKSTIQIVPEKIYKLSLYQTTFSILTFFILVAGFIVSDFSLITVFQNSNTLKPFFYKITGTWGNHEGSLLLWINVMVIFSYLFLIYNKKAEKNFRLFTLITHNILILGFLLFLFF